MQAENDTGCPTALARTARIGTAVIAAAALFGVGMLVGIVSEGNAETIAVFSKKACDQSRAAYYVAEAPAQAKQAAGPGPGPSSLSAQDGPAAEPDELTGVDAWPANNKVVWSTSIAPGADVGTIRIHNASDSDNRQLLFRLDGDHGPQLAARLYVSASADAQITLPAGDYQIDLVSTPRGLAWKDVLSTASRPAFHATIEAGDADDSKRIVIPADPNARPPKPRQSARPKRKEPSDYGAIGPAASDQQNQT